MRYLRKKFEWRPAEHVSHIHQNSKPRSFRDDSASQADMGTKTGVTKPKRSQSEAEDFTESLSWSRSCFVPMSAQRLLCTSIISLEIISSNGNYCARRLGEIRAKQGKGSKNFHWTQKGTGWFIFMTQQKGAIFCFTTCGGGRQKKYNWSTQMDSLHIDKK